MARTYGNGIAVTTDGGGAVNPASHTHAATDITTGDFADARLSANVPLLDGTNARSDRTKNTPNERGHLHRTEV